MGSASVCVAVCCLQQRSPQETGGRRRRTPPAAARCTRSVRRRHVQTNHGPKLFIQAVRSKVMYEGDKVGEYTTMPCAKYGESGASAVGGGGWNDGGWKARWRQV